MPNIKYKLEFKGGVYVHDCPIYRQTDSIIAFVIDTSNFYGTVSYTGSDENGIPCIGLEPYESSFGDTTEISFPDYFGWDIFSYQWAKYSVHVCLVKN